MISYIGGKSRMAKWICEYIPEDITTYVEVFGGAFWVYIKGDIYKKPKLKQVIYNDKNRFMTNLFKCFTYPEYFCEILGEAKSQNEELFYMCQENLNNISQDKFRLGNADIGSQYAYVATQVFSGSKVLESKFINLKGKYSSKYDALRRRLQKKDVIERLEKISKCENLSYEDILSKYDNPKTFFYVDPPYWKTENYYSNHDFDRDDHEKLCKMLKNIDGKFALSYYDFPLLKDWLPKDEYRWIEKEFAKAAGAQKGKKQNKGTELLIMNY